MRYETMEEQEDRTADKASGIPPTPPSFCPTCDRESCLLWRAERRLLLQRRASMKAITFGLRWGAIPTVVTNRSEGMP